MNGTVGGPGAPLDRLQLRVLLRTYARLSMRGKATQSMSRRRSGGSRGMIGLVAMYLFFGLILGFVARTHPDLFSYSLIVHTMTFVMVGTCLLVEAGDILFSVAENDTLGFLPIHPRTLLLAKTLNLLGFATLLALALNLFPLFFGIAARGSAPWFPLVHLLSVTLNAAFCAGGVVFVHALVIRIVSREKFDSIATWSQIGMSVLFFVGYQLMPRLLERLVAVDLHGVMPYFFLWPPAWFAGLDAVLAGGQFHTWPMILAGPGLAVTVLLGAGAIPRLATGYASGLTRLGESTGRAARPARVGRSRGVGKSSALLRRWIPDPVERASYRLAVIYMRRDREARLRLYPSLGGFVILPLLTLLDPKHRSSGPHTMLLLIVWMQGMTPTVVLESLRMSSQCAAAEVFSVAPLESSASLFHGVRKAAIYGVMLPIMALSLVLVLVLKPGIWADLSLAVPALLALPVLSLMPALTGPYLPLSESPRAGSQSARNLTIWFGGMAVTGVLYGIAALARRGGVLWPMVGIEIVLVIGVYRHLLRRVGRCPILLPEEKSELGPPASSPAAAV